MGATEADEAAVRAVVDRINAAWADHDAATMVLSGDRFLRGRETIRTDLVREFQGRHRSTKLISDVVDLRFLGTETAVMITEGGVLAPEREIRATWTCAKQDGEWYLAAYQNTRNADGKLPVS